MVKRILMCAVVSILVLGLSGHSVNLGRPHARGILAASFSAEAAGSQSEQEIDRLIESVKWGDTAEACRAAEELGRLKAVRAVEPLVSVLIYRVKPDWSGFQLGCAVRDALVTIGGTRAVELLIAALNTNLEAPTLVWVVETLGKLRDTRAVEPLIEVLEQNTGNTKDSEDVRYSVIEALGTIGDARAVQPIITTFWSRDRRNYIAAFRALWNLRDAGVIEPLCGLLVHDDPDVCIAAAQFLGEIGDPRAVEPLVAGLKSNAKAQREAYSAIIDALGKIGKPAADALLEALHHWNPRVRSAAAKYLGEIRDPRAVAPLVVAFLKDEDPVVRSCAAAALGEIKNPSVVEPMIEALGDADDNTRISAAAILAAVLGETQDARAVQPLIGALKDKNSTVRAYAAEALGKTKDPLAVLPLILALSDKDANVRSKAARSLEQMTGKYLGQDPQRWMEWYKQTNAGP